MVGSGDYPLSLANRHVHLADSLLSMYSVNQEPRLLLRTLEHCANAIEEASEALLKAAGTDGSTDLTEILDELNLSSGESAVRLHADIRQILDSFKESPQVFTRDDKFIIASKEFNSLTEVDFQTVEAAINTVKKFVYEAGRMTVMREVNAW